MNSQSFEHPLSFEKGIFFVSDNEDTEFRIFINSENKARVALELMGRYYISDYVELKDEHQTVDFFDSESMENGVFSSSLCLYEQLSHQNSLEFNGIHFMRRHYREVISLKFVNVPDRLQNMIVAELNSAFHFVFLFKKSAGTFRSPDLSINFIQDPEVDNDNDNDNDEKMKEIKTTFPKFIKVRLSDLHQRRSIDVFRSRIKEKNLANAIIHQMGHVFNLKQENPMRIHYSDDSASSSPSSSRPPSPSPLIPPSPSVAPSPSPNPSVSLSLLPVPVESKSHSFFQAHVYSDQEREFLILGRDSQVLPGTLFEDFDYEHEKVRIPCWNCWIATQQKSKKGSSSSALPI